MTLGGDSLFGRVDPKLIAVLATGTSDVQSHEDLRAVDAVMQEW